MRLPSSASLAEALRHPAAFISGDSANVRRLAAQLGCSLDDAAAVYRLARRDGYASAYRAVFGASGKARGGIRRRQTRRASAGGGIAATAPRASTASGRPG